MKTYCLTSSFNKLSLLNEKYFNIFISANLFGKKNARQISDGDEYIKKGSKVTIGCYYSERWFFNDSSFILFLKSLHADFPLQCDGTRYDRYLRWWYKRFLHWPYKSLQAKKKIHLQKSVIHKLGVNESPRAQLK